MKKFIIAAIIIIATMVATFWATMSNLKIEVNEEENGAMVECFGQVWYCETEEI